MSDLPILVPLCNGTDYHGSDGEEQIRRALRVACSLRGSTVRMVALVYGFQARGLRRLREAGYDVIDRSEVPQHQFSLMPFLVPSRHTSTSPAPFLPSPEAGRRWHPSVTVQQRRDFKCTSLKLLAWNLTVRQRSPAKLTAHLSSTCMHLPFVRHSRAS